MSRSIAGRIWIQFGFSMAAFAMIGSLVYLQVYLSQEASRAVIRAEKVLNQINMPLTMLRTIESKVRGFIITGDENYLTEFQPLRADLDEQIEQLRMGTTAEAEQRARASTCRLCGRACRRSRRADRTAPSAGLRGGRGRDGREP